MDYKGKRFVGFDAARPPVTGEDWVGGIDWILPRGYPCAVVSLDYRRYLPRPQTCNLMTSIRLPARRTTISSFFSEPGLRRCVDTKGSSNETNLSTQPNPAKTSSWLSSSYEDPCGSGHLESATCERSQSFGCNGRFEVILCFPERAALGGRTEFFVLVVSVEFWQTASDFHREIS